MKEELTTAMHTEFMKGEASSLHLKVMAVWSQTHREKPLSLSKACKKEGITIEEYNANLDEVIG